jgi:hypothetical protein
VETRPITRLALSRAEAAAALGVSIDHFERHIQPHLHIVYAGKRRLIPTKELERYLAEHATNIAPDRQTPLSLPRFSGD